jgi:probable O-glycosylation ligase (exosortase A-associated)
MKVHLMTLVTLAMLRDRRRLEQLLGVLALSIGYFSVKGGIWILMGGGSRVWGPPGSLIEDNNALAVASIMVIPLVRYFQMRAQQRWVRVLLGIAMALSVASILGSYSRGGLIALAAMATFMFWKSRRRVLLALVFVALASGLLAFMPAQWEERMATIQDYGQDSSASSRLLAWQTMINLAKDRPLVGGGFMVDDEAVFRKYSPDPAAGVYVAHSIYFQALGEHGIVGLGLMLAMLVGSWRTAGGAAKRAEARGPDWRWASDMARMIQVSLSGFAVGGAFLNLLHFDLYYYLIACVAALAVLVRVPDIVPARATSASERSSLRSAHD